jgi:hypothetical protein
MNNKWENYRVEDLLYLLEQSEERLKRFIEIDAPEILIQKEKELIEEKRDAIRMLSN